MGTMKITINGTLKNLTANSQLSDIVTQFCSKPKSIITEVNGRIIPSNDWSNTPLREGDTVELVAFVGGG